MMEIWHVFFGPQHFPTKMPNHDNFKRRSIVPSNKMSVALSELRLRFVAGRIQGWPLELKPY